MLKKIRKDKYVIWVKWKETKQNILKGDSYIQIQSYISSPKPRKIFEN